MKKEDIRKEYFKLRIKGHSQNQCRKILLAEFGYEVSKRTLQRWTQKHNQTLWDFKDKSRKPKRIYTKLNPEIESKVINLRNKTGWGEDKLSTQFPNLSHKLINKILNKYNLTNPNPRRKKRLKYIRWQRKHTNSLWQMDISDQKIKDKYCFAVIDDCSRYCIGLVDLNRATTKAVTHILDELGKTHGYPREILTDNGGTFGLKSKHSKFDRWCRRRGIKHIRTAIHSPTTTGKIERFFQSLSKELQFCRCHNEFRMRYNHFRPHTSLNRRCPSDIYHNIWSLN